MTQPPHPGQYPVPPAPRKSRTGVIIAVVAALVVLLCSGAVAALVAAGDDGSAVDDARAAADRANAQAASARPSSPPGRATTKAPANTDVVIGNGTYRVGEDIPPGRYKVTERADDLCYWERSKGIGNTIANNIGGGFPQFTARNGEDITIQQCPDFRLLPK
jgi:hypothetical protein